MTELEHSRIRRERRIQLVAFAAVTLICAPASAEVEGTAPAKVANWRLFGAHSATGAALMVPGPYEAEVNSVLLSGATADMLDTPFDADVVAAFLFWSGSAPRTDRSGPPDAPDRDADFTVADGTFYNDLSVDTDPTGFGACFTADALGGFYYCRRDVTDIVRAQGIGNVNGIYTVGDIDADPGSLDNTDPQRINAQAKYAAWSLVLVWQSSTEAIRRDVVLYDGFLRLDETTASAGIHTFTIGDFLVGSPPLGRLTVFGMEGDRQLGVPPQDSTGCPNCWDFISFEAASAAGTTVLSNGENPAHNSFNSSWDTSVDIDTYFLDGLISTGDATAEITLGSGDGVVDAAYNQGNGESFMAGWVIMTIDTLTPSFSGSQTRKTVVPVVAGPGQSLFYLIDVVNEGSADATNVVVQDSIPAGAAYISGSTRIDGVPVPDDAGAASPLVAGLNIGSVPAAVNGDHTRQVTFEVRVDPAACGGSVVNSATVDSDETDPVAVGPVTTDIVSTVLEPPTKSIAFVSPPPAGPGAAFSYTIDIVNNGAQDAGGVTVDDPLPANVVVTSVFATSGTWSLTGNTLTVSDLTVPSYGSAQVVVVARVMTVAELVGAGILEDEIDGLLISNQATVSGGCTPDQLTDDPDIPGFQPTEFTLTYAPALGTSNKTGADVNGGPLEPDDTILYTVTVTNTGNRVAEVIATDSIPANTTYVSGSTQVDGVPVPDGAGGVCPLVGGLSLGDVPYVGDNDRAITFEVVVDTLAPNGTVIQNSADLSVPVAPSADTTVTSAPLTVVATPELTMSAKSVVDAEAPLGVFEPGEEVVYTIEVTNSGNRPATSVVVTDAIPPELVFVSASGNGTASGGTVTWTRGAVPPGTTVSLTFRARIVTPLDNGTVVSNTATIASNELPDFTTAAATFVVVSAPLLLVEKLDSHPSLPARPGDPVRYTITIRNEGTAAARDIVVTDPLDPSLADAVAPTGQVAGGLVTWDAGSDPRLAQLDPGAGTIDLILDATVFFPLASGTEVVNQATATPAGFSPALSDDPDDPTGSADPTRFVVVSQATLAVTKTVEDLTPGSPPLPGDRVRYTLALAAGGDAPLGDVVVTDPVDSSLQNVDASMSSGSVVGGVVTWSPATGSSDLALLEPGDIVDLVFEAEIRPGTPNGTVVTNQATALSSDLAGPTLSDDPAFPGPTDPTVFTVVSTPVLELVKTVALVGDDDPDFNPGDVVEYTLTLTNVGTGATADPVITDTFDANLTIVSADGGSVSGQTITWPTAPFTLLPGAQIVVRPRLRIAFPLDDGTVISNQGRASSVELPGPALSDDPSLPGLDDPTAFTIASAPDFTATTKSVGDLTDDPLVTRPGDLLEYTIEVRNDGDSDADDVVVRDSVPADVDVTVPGNARLDGGDIVWDQATEPALVHVPAGGSVTLVFAATVEAPLANGTLISNQALVESAEVTTPVPSDDPGTVAVDDPTVVTVVSASDLGASTKLVTDLGGVPIATARPGDTVRYTLAITNRGDATAANVEVTDPVDPSLLVVAAPDGTVSGGIISWDPSGVPALAAVAPNDVVLLTFDAQLKTPLDDGLVIVNQGSITAEDVTDPVLTDADPATVPKEETTLTVISSADLTGSLKRFVDPAGGAVLDEARPGDTIRVQLTLRNSGDAIARDVQVEDALDASLLTNIVVRDGGTLVGGTARWAVSEVAPGVAGEVVLRVDARLRTPLDPTTLVNQAFLGIGAPPTIPTDDPTQPGAADPTVLDIISSADLSASTKDVVAPDGREVGPGEVFTYPITIANTGDGNARDIVVTDALPPEIEFVSASAGGAYDGVTHTVLWGIPIVAGGSETTVSLAVRVGALMPNGTVIDNQAQIVADALPPEPTDDPIAATPDTPTRVTVVAAASFATFEKTVVNLDETEPGLLRPGDRLRYTLRLQNDGNSVARDVEVRDAIDPSLTDVQPVTPFVLQGDTVVFDGTVVPGLALVEPAAEVTLVFDATVAPEVSDGTAISNQGLAASVDLPAQEASDDPSTPATDDPTVLVVRFPELRIHKAWEDANGGDPEPGDTINFTLTVENAGSFPAQNVVVVDAVSNGFDQIDAPGATSSGGTLTWQVGSLGAQEVTTLSFSVRIVPGLANGTRLLNRAAVGASGVDPVESNEVAVQVVATPDFTATTKTVATPNPLVVPGDVLSYEILVRNDGSGAGTDVRITDAIDPNLTVLPETITANGTLTGNSIAWLLGVVGAGGQRVVRFDAQVRAETPNRTVIDNQAYVGSPPELPRTVPSDDPTTAALDDPTSVIVISEPELGRTTLAATDLNGGTLLPGDTIRYELRVVNNGNLTSLETEALLAVPPYTGYVRDSTLLNGAQVPEGPDDAPLAVGLLVSSADPTAGPGVLLQDDGILPDDEHAVVVFEAQVDPRALPGTVISAQASVTALDARPTVSDNPATGGIDGDATVLVVGGGPVLAVAKTASPAGAVNVGDTLEYRIVVQNAGDAPSPELRLTDPLPENATYVSGTLTRDGQALTDAPDGDPGELLPNGGLVVTLDSIPAGGQRVVTADVRVAAGPWVANQALVEAGGRVWLSDGDPTAAGAQPTISMVDTSAELVGVALDVGDTNGGTVEPLDRLRYALSATNDGARPLYDVALHAPRPDHIGGLAIVDSSFATLVGSEAPTWTVPRLDPGERIRVVFDVEVASAAVPGDLIETLGRAETDTASFATDLVRVVVGGGVGSGGIGGRVFRDLGERDGIYTEGTDEALAGFSILLVPEDHLDEATRGVEFESLAIRSKVVGRDGGYYLAGVPSGRYQLWVASGEGTVFARSDLLNVSGGTAVSRDLPVDPSGIIYQNADGVALPVGGARVFLVDDGTGLDLPPSALTGGQQGQVTTGQGFYRFDVRPSALPGEFRIRVEPPAQTMVFPSVTNPPAGATDLAPFGELAVAGPGGRVVESDNPDLGADTTYYLRFQLDGSTDYLNNHIPIDRLSEHIRITKRVSRRTARIGEVLTYTVEIVNPLDQGFLVGADGSGGVVLVDDLPAGISWPGGSASIVVRSGGRTGDARSLATTDVTARSVRFEPLSLPEQSTVTMRYYAVVGIRAKGEQVNRARLVDRGGAALSGEAAASVRIVEDPIFDQGTVLGRVFCDDGDGELGPTDSGLPGARVYLDTGFFVDTDPDGKFHFRGVRPGRHAVKLDLNTAPPGSSMTTDVLREVYISRGLLAKVSFGVRCAWRSTTPTHVTLEGPPPPPAKPIAVVAVNPELPAIALDGRAQPIPLVDAVLTEAGAPPDFASGAGINLAGAGELVWHIQSAGRVRFAQWQISIMTVDGAEVWRVAGEGRPPARVPWLTTEEDVPLEPGVEYLYRIAAVSVDGDLGEGRWRRLGVRIGAPKQPPDSAAIATWRGKLFRGTTDEPTRELKKRVAGLVEKLTAGGTEKIAVEVHLAVSRKRSANLLLSQRRAVAIRKLFVDAGYPDTEIRALGRGDTQPVMPNVSRKARELNRRILVKRDLPAHQTGPLAPIAYPGFLRIGPHLVEYGRETIEQRVEVEAGDEIVLELREVNGRRVRLARTYPFGSAATGGQRSVDLAVTGTLVPPTLRLGDDPIALPLLDSSCEMASEPPTVSGQGLTPPARFVIETKAPIRSWLVRVLNPEGTVLRDLTGDGDPPEAVEWDGKNAAGTVVVRQGDFVFRCLLTDVDGNRVVSPKRPLPIGVATGPSYERVLDQGLYPESGKLEGPLEEELNRIVAAVEANPGARVRVEVHDVADGGKMQAQIRTARLAAKLKASLTGAGIPEEALEVVALGASRPIMAGSTRRARGANRRVVIQIHAPDAGREPAGEPVPPERHVRLAGVEMDVADDGSFSGTIVVEQDATLVADVAVGDGRTAIYHVPMFDGRPMDARASTLPQAFRPSPGEEPIGSRPATLMQTPAPPPVPPTSVRASIVGGGLVDAVAGWSPRMPASGVALPSGPIVLHEPEAPPGERPVEMAQAMPSGAQPVTLPIAEAPPTAAADLHAWLPDEGAELAGGRLTVRGQANDRNVVKVNGEVVALDDLGRFVHTLELPPGDAKLEITSEDEAGNVARIERPLRVPAGEWFLLALGDGVAGWGGKLEGMNDDTTIDFKSETYLHGRAAVYFKGSMDGSALFGTSPFETLRLTGHLDTGKERDSDLVKQLIDPEAYYPAYGDTAEEVQDVSTRSKGYLRLEADRSRLTVGNFETQIDGMELFRFHRTYFGGSLDVDHAFLAKSPTELHAFYASGEAGIRHRQLIFQGTGGSMFFLRDADLLEGSERVELVVRDAITGSRLMTARQVRNVDYTIDYRDGRLVFAQPIPSTVASGWRLDQNPVHTLDGHSVFVEVEYDYNAAIPQDGETAFAAQVRQTLFDTVTVGGGYVDEDKRDAGGPRYQLFGGELRVEALEETRLDVEVAYSRAQDAEHFISYDGGVSYAEAGGARQFRDGDASERIPEDAEGWAAKLRLSGDIGEIAGRPAWVGSDEGGRPGRFLPYTLTMHHQDSGFYSGSSVLEQGQTKVSGQIRAVLTDVDSMRLRHDGVWSRLFIGGNEQMVNRQMSFLGYEREGQTWKAGLEVGHTYWDDSQRVVNTDSVTAYGEARLTDRLTLTGEQEAILRGDDRVLSGIGDQLVTTAGAKYQIAERLWLTASESVRWSGTNATQIGLKTKLSDDISLYANERLTAGNGRQVSTTVLGGESTAIPGSRSYAEYQLSSMASGRSGRAVFGMDNRWVLSEGLKLSLAYERSQLVGRPNGSLGASLGAGTAVADPQTTGYGSGPLNRDQQFSASGYSSGGVFPVGVSSRDAFSVGLELLRMTTLKAGVRFEIRYDRGDADLGADDRLVLSGQAGGDWRFDRRLVLLGRLRGASVHNLTFREDVDSALGFTEGQYMDVSIGLAYRPVHSDTFEALVKWTRRYNRKPVTADLSRYQLEIADVISAEPVVEFGYGVQAVGKVAVKAFEVQDADLPRIRSSMLLGLLRLNYHLTEMFDVGAEYRWLGNFLTDEEEHGTLVEVVWIPVRYVSVGVGYNFTHFSDDLLADPTTDSHGAFLRVSGRY